MCFSLYRVEPKVSTTTGFIQLYAHKKNLHSLQYTQLKFCTPGQCTKHMSFYTYLYIYMLRHSLKGPSRECSHERTYINIQQLKRLLSKSVK